MGNQTRKRGCFHRLNGQFHRHRDYQYKIIPAIPAKMIIKIGSRHADQQVRGAVVLPNGTGKNVRVLAICKGANEELAKEAGADFVGSPIYANVSGE